MRLKCSILCFAASLAIQAQAIDFIVTNGYLVAADEIVQDEQWVVTGVAETKGTFKNDLFVAAGNPLQLDGTYEGNIWSASSMEATLSGNCSRNARLAAGKTVRITGQVGGNLMALAETIILASNSVVQGNANLLAYSIILEGAIDGDVDLTAARIVTLGGSIRGNVEVLAPDVLFSRETRIGGNLDYSANKELFPEEGIIAGTLKRNQPPSLYSKARMLTHTLWFVAAFIAGVPFITLFPMTAAMASQQARRSPIKCMLVGFVASGALPMFGIMCASAIIGVPLGALILAFWGIILYLSRIVAGLVVGTLILRSANTSIGRIVLAMALGLALIYFATFLPAIGTPIQLSITWIGMGSLLLTMLHKRRLILQVQQNSQQIETLKSEQSKTMEEKP